MKLSVSSGPKTNDGFASGVGVGRGGRVRDGGALIRELPVGLPVQVPINDDSPLGEQESSSGEHRVAAANEPLDGEVEVEGSVVVGS